VGHIECMGQKRNTYEVSVEEPEGKRPLRRPSHRCEDDIKMNLKVGYESMCWSHLDQHKD